MRRKKKNVSTTRKRQDKLTDDNLYNMGVKLSNLKYGGNVAQSLQNLDLTKLN